MKRFLLIVLALLAGPAILAVTALAAPAFGQTLAALRTESNVRIVVPVRDIARGEVITDSDLTTAQVGGGAMMAGIVTSMDTLTGMQARRVLRAGEGLRTDDVRRPVVVSKGQTVTMTFSAPGVELTAMGRAMSEGGVGDMVTVQNPASFRMITATVTAPGTVRAIAGAPTARK